MNKLLPFVAILLLCSCSTVSNTEELAEVGVTSKVHVAGNWQAVYRSIEARMQQCYNRNGPFMGNAMQVRGQLYDELKMGEIVGTTIGGALYAHQSPYVTLQVRPDGDASEVTIIARKAWSKDMEKLVPLWATTDSTACQP